MLRASVRDARSVLARTRVPVGLPHPGTHCSTALRAPCAGVLPGKQLEAAENQIEDFNQLLAELASAPDSLLHAKVRHAPTLRHGAWHEQLARGSGGTGMPRPARQHAWEGTCWAALATPPRCYARRALRARALHGGLSSLPRQPRALPRALQPAQHPLRPRSRNWTLQRASTQRWRCCWEGRGPGRSGDHMGPGRALQLPTTRGCIGPSP